VKFTTEIIKMVANERKIKVAALFMMLDDGDDELFTYVTSKNKIDISTLIFSTTYVDHQ
jgi:hypothetical protein